MDKNEYRAKLDEITDLVDRQDYKGALKIVDTIDWRRVRSARTLCMVGEIYEANKRYNDLLTRERLLEKQFCTDWWNFPLKWETLTRLWIIINGLWKYLPMTTAVIS